jgi:hypothetical protein
MNQMPDIKGISLRVAAKFAEKVDVPPDFQGDPKTHGIEQPRGGGFSIMQNLQKSLVKEEEKERKEGEKKKEQEEEKINASDLREFRAAVRQAMYWCNPGRTYRLTKQEQNGNAVVCPQCKTPMEKERFTRSEKMFRCPKCGFKVPTGKVTTQKVEIEIEPNGEVEVEVTTAKLKGRRCR